MAPEQLDGSGAGPPADIYALAAIAFEALSGKKPREGRTPMEIAHKIATEGAPDLRDAWPNAPKEAAQVLQRGMALKPSDRPSTASELARELGAALEADPGRTRKTRRLGRAAGAGAAGAGAAAAAGAGAGAAAAASKPDTNGAARDTTPTPTRSPAPTGPPASPPPPIRSGRSSRRPGAGAIALALVFLALAGAAIAGSVLSGGDDGSDSSGADGTAAREGRAEKPKKQKKPKEPKEPKEQPAAAPAPAEEAPAEDTGSYDPAQGAALNNQGFELMQQERYDEAVPVLQQAVDSFPPGTDDVNYAYALFNLGKSLRLAGRPEEAIPILEQRLEIPNQTETVQAELDLARQAAAEG
jgi:tetratricopeptide (TPR) repeat protein